MEYKNFGAIEFLLKECAGKDYRRDGKHYQGSDACNFFKELSDKIIDEKLPNKKPSIWQSGFYYRTYLWNRYYDSNIDNTKGNIALTLAANYMGETDGLEITMRLETEDNLISNLPLEDKKQINRLILYPIDGAIYRDNTDLNKIYSYKEALQAIEDDENYKHHPKFKIRTDYVFKKPYNDDEIERIIQEGRLMRDKYIKAYYEAVKGGYMDMKENLGKNLILYGPPGTGKTYYTKIYAVAICENVSIAEVEQRDYEKEIIPAYNKYLEEGRIAFTTFHQSYGYEEFIEGIKPIPYEKDGEKKIYYDVKPGVFKKFCDNVSTFKDISIKDIDPTAKIYKVALGTDKGGKIKQSCFENGFVRINWPTKEESEEELSYLHKGDIVLSIKTRTSIDGIGVVIDDDMVVLDETDYKYAKRIKWLLTNQIIEIKDKYNNGKYLPIRTIESLPNIKIEDIIDILKENNISVETIKNEDNYVFVIDEINRGNISKIFGELITLIEASKRRGASESSTCTLPYSNEQFSVPNNVYILGTMNTADRSIAIMDTALRRRFEFIEMLPNSSILEGLIIDGVNIKNMLDAINSRIRVLYDRDHTIGHAFFTDLDSHSTIEDLSKVFKDKIIPLLQEYFYEDYSKIRLVLGDNSKEEQYQFIRETKNNSKAIFKGNVTQDEIAEYDYEINESALHHKESYIQII